MLCHFMTVQNLKNGTYKWLNSNLYIFKFYLWFTSLIYKFIAFGFIMICKKKKGVIFKWENKIYNLKNP